MINSSFYSDGKTAQTHDVKIEFLTDSIQFYHQNEAVKWNYDEIQLVDPKVQKIYLLTNPDARLTLSYIDFEAFLLHCPKYNKKGRAKSEFKLIMTLVALGFSICAIVFFGIPILAHPLAKITPPNLERQLSNSVTAQLDLAMDFCKTDTKSIKNLQKLADKISQNADLSFPIEVGGLNTSMPNAFAMPAGKIYFTKGLIETAENGDEVAAVMAHEIAHVENRDVLVSLYRVMGFGIILDAVVGGGSGAGQQLIMLGANLSDLKNSRDAEGQADIRGLEILTKSGIDGHGMSSFFEKIQKIEDNMGVLKGSEFISSHPDSGKRSEIAAKMAKAGNPAFTDQEWQEVKEFCK